jgi:hypothetical protein
MLEARDRMSRPLQQAARASQNLQGRVTQLSRSLNSSRSSINNATVANRVLAERYRELGRRIGATDEQVRLSVRLFRQLPAPIRLAAYSIEGYARALKLAITQNILVRTTTKLVTTAFKALYAVTWNLTHYLGLAVRKLWEFSRVGKVLKLMWAPFKLAGQGAKYLNGQLLRLIKNTFVFRMMSAAVKAVGRDIKWAAIGFKTFIKDIPHLVKGTRAWQMYSYGVGKAKQQIVAARLAFELWKNSSNTAKKISNAMEDIAWHGKQVWLTIKRNVDALKQMGNNAQQAGSRGRATFNQLVDANARLNRQLEQMNRQLSRGQSKLSSMKNSLSGLNHMGAAFGIAYAGQAAYGQAKETAGATVGKAMEQNYSSASIGILAGAEKGEKYYKAISDYAATTAYSTEDWSRNMRSAVLKSKNTKDLDKYMTAMDQLATMDPMQGLDGAALAIRELNSGDITSLVERFELPRTALKGIKTIVDPIEQIEALSKLVGDNTGYTVDNIKKMKELPLMQWQKMTNSIKTAMGYMGKGALDVIAPLMEKFNNMWDAGAFDGIISKGKELLAGIATGLSNLINKMANFDGEGMKAKFQPFITLFGNIWDTLKEAWPNISQILSDFKTAASGIADAINNNWPTINGLIQDAVELLADITDWATNNTATIISAIGGVAAAFATWKILTTVATALRLLREGLLLTTVAVWLMDTGVWALTAALFANPLVWITALLVGLGVGLYIAYQKSETFRNAVQACWNWIKGVGIGIGHGFMAVVHGIADAFKSVVDWVGKAWDKFMGFIKAFKNNPIGTLVEGAKTIASKIGIGGGKKHHGGLERVPYDGYQATLHKGERVLTRSEVNGYGQSSGMGVTITGNTFHVRQDSDIDAIATALYEKMFAAKTAMG